MGGGVGGGGWGSRENWYGNWGDVATAICHLHVLIIVNGLFKSAEQIESLFSS